MTTTQALAKLYKNVTGSKGRNTIAKILSDLADAWTSDVQAPTAVTQASVPTLTSNGTKYYVLKVVKSSGGTTYTWDEKTFT